MSVKSQIRQHYGIVAALLVCFTCGANAQQDAPAGVTAEQPRTEAKQAEEAAKSDADPSDAERRELGADEDPMAASDARREVQRVEEKKGTPQRTTGFDVYGSIRVPLPRAGGRG